MTPNGITSHENDIVSFSEVTSELKHGFSDRTPVEANFSACVQIGHGTHMFSYTIGVGVSFPDGANHPPPSSVLVKERVEIYLYSLSGPSRPVLGRTFMFKKRHVIFTRHSPVVFCKIIPRELEKMSPLVKARPR